MKHLKRYGVLLLLVVSLSFNLSAYLRLREANEKIDETNRVVSLQVERSIRQSMGFTNELIETQSHQAMLNLQRTIQDLTVAFQHWVTINQKERNPNGRLERGLSGIESMRNVILHHLNNQYTANNNTLNDYDLELLQQVSENLDRLLMVYHNINERLPELKVFANSDGGLVHVASNIEEMTRLYRHSIEPNKHPNYVEPQIAVATALQQFPALEKYKLGDLQEVQIRDGVHSYQLRYHKNKDLMYVVAVDAINLGIRNYEIHSGSSSPLDLNLSKDEALESAQEYIRQFYDGAVATEYFEITEAASEDVIYAFRFTPIINGIRVVSDAFFINISSTTGLVRYSNDFMNSEIPNYTLRQSTKDIIEANREEIGELEYEGLSLIRSFHTLYQPRVAYSFKVSRNEQQLLVFFDVETGNQINSIYNIYQPID